MSEEVKTEEPKVETKEPKENNELQAMLKKLDELGISKPEQLDNKAKAASEAGRLANMVGELREEIASLKNRPQEPASAPQTEYDSDGVDIEAVIRGSVAKELDARESRARKQHMARMKEVHAIRSDDNYNVVGKKFEYFMSSPEGQAAISNGASPTNIYNKMVVKEYRDMMVNMKSAVESSSGNPGQVPIPHMEDGQTAPPRIEPSDERKGKIKKLRENWSGNDEDIDKMLNVLLPSGSLPMPTR